MRKIFVSTVVAAAACVPVLASAQQTPAPQTPPEHTVAGNMMIASDYRFRGISQTFLQPAIQGGVDYSHASGVYLGNWNSSVSGLSYANAAGIEMDFYGGWKGAVAADVTLDVGLLQYYYPNAKIVTAAGDEKYDTLEAYVGVSYKFLSVKYSHAISDFFGLTTDSGGKDSKGSNYLDVSASYEVMPKLTLAAHVGKLKVKNYSQLDYTDYKLGVTYDMSGWLLGAAYVSTNADKAFYTLVDGAGKSKEIGKGGLVLSVGKTF
jgi:uncharacterized protein (TIGR02001 family)